MVQLLLEHKANINVQDSFNRSPLHWSVVRADSLDCLKLLLKYNPSVSVKDRDGLTPAMWACHLDHLEHFKLLSKIDNVNRKFDSISRSELETDNDGRTWIHWSVRKTEPIQCLNVSRNLTNAKILTPVSFFRVVSSPVHDQFRVHLLARQRGQDVSARRRRTRCLTSLQTDN